MSGKYAYFICERSGFRCPDSERRRERGTGYLVGASEMDVDDLQTHPQNQPPPTKVEGHLEDARPDVVLATTGDSTWTPSMTTAY
jgi:hypothetical protein